MAMEETIGVHKADRERGQTDGGDTDPQHASGGCGLSQSSHFVVVFSSYCFLYLHLHLHLDGTKLCRGCLIVPLTMLYRV